MNHPIFTTKQEIEEWLLNLNVTKYTIRSDLIVDVFENINLNLHSCELYIPVQFGIVEGDFNCQHCKLLSLKGCPDTVQGNFNCGFNNLKSLEYCPKNITGDFNCKVNKLTTLKGCPEIINSHFNCSINQLTDLIDGPKIVKGDFNCSSNKLITLKGCPEVDGKFSCNNNELTSLQYISKHMKNSLLCYENNINTFEHFPDTVGNVLNMIKNNISEEECLNFNTHVQSNILTDFGRKEKFLTMVAALKSQKENDELNSVLNPFEKEKTNKYRL